MTNATNLQSFSIRTAILNNQAEGGGARNFFDGAKVRRSLGDLTRSGRYCGATAA